MLECKLLFYFTWVLPLLGKQIMKSGGIAA